MCFNYRYMDLCSLMLCGTTAYLHFPVFHAYRPVKNLRIWMCL